MTKTNNTKPVSSSSIKEVTFNQITDAFVTLNPIKGLPTLEELKAPKETEEKTTKKTTKKVAKKAEKKDRTRTEPKGSGRPDNTKKHIETVGTSSLRERLDAIKESFEILNEVEVRKENIVNPIEEMSLAELVAHQAADMDERREINSLITEKEMHTSPSYEVHFSDEALDKYADGWLGNQNVETDGSSLQQEDMRLILSREGEGMERILHDDEYAGYYSDNTRITDEQIEIADMYLRLKDMKETSETFAKWEYMKQVRAYYWSEVQENTETAYLLYDVAHRKAELRLFQMDKEGIEPTEEQWEKLVSWLNAHLKRAGTPYQHTNGKWYLDTNDQNTRFGKIGQVHWDRLNRAMKYTQKCKDFWNTREGMWLSDINAQISDAWELCVEYGVNFRAYNKLKNTSFNVFETWGGHDSTDMIIEQELGVEEEREKGPKEDRRMDKNLWRQLNGIMDNDEFGMLANVYRDKKGRLVSLGMRQVIPCNTSEEAVTAYQMTRFVDEALSDYTYPNYQIREGEFIWK